MRGLKFLGDRRAEVADFPEVEPGPDQALIRMRASGICGSDLPQYRAPYDPESPGKRPGHEPCGEVAAIGKLVTGFMVGDRVMQHHYEGCKRCGYCRSGWQQLCPVQKDRLYYGRSAHGGHGDYMVAHHSTLVGLPNELTFEEGAFLACGAAPSFLLTSSTPRSAPAALKVNTTMTTGFSAPQASCQWETRTPRDCRTLGHKPTKHLRDLTSSSTSRSAGRPAASTKLARPANWLSHRCSKTVGLI